MSYLNPDQMNDGNSQLKTILPDQAANIVLVSYDPFKYGANKDKTMPKHLAKNADTGEDLEFVGLAFHEAIKPFNEQIIPQVSVLHVECLNNGTKYPDYSIKMVLAGEKGGDAYLNGDAKKPVKTDDGIPF